VILTVSFHDAILLQAMLEALSSPNPNPSKSTLDQSLCDPVISATFANRYQAHALPSLPLATRIPPLPMTNNSSSSNSTGQPLSPRSKGSVFALFAGEMNDQQQQNNNNTTQSTTTTTTTTTTSGNTSLSNSAKASQSQAAAKPLPRLSFAPIVADMSDLFHALAGLPSGLGQVMLKRLVNLLKVRMIV
jgi:hypothetical protein